MEALPFFENRDSPCHLSHAPSQGLLPEPLIQWLLTLPLSDRFFLLRMPLPHLNRAIKNALLRLRFLQRSPSVLYLDSMGPPSENTTSHLAKKAREAPKTAIDGLFALTTGKEFQDFVALEAYLVKRPQLINLWLQHDAALITDTNAAVKAISKASSLAELDALLKGIIKKEIYPHLSRCRMKLPKKQKGFMKELWKHWESSRQEDRMRILRLGQPSFDALFERLLLEGVMVPLQTLERLTQECLELGKACQVTNRLFRSRMDNIWRPQVIYYEKVFDYWKQDIKMRRKRLKKAKRPTAEVMGRRGCSHMLSHLQSLKSVLSFSGQKSIGADSNDTNESETLICEDLDRDRKKYFTQALEDKVQAQIDSISQDANKYHHRRIITFERVQYMLFFYRIPIKLFGSCANGITIKNSDIDIAIDSCIMGMNGPPYAQQQLVSALEWVQKFLVTQVWVKSSKLIRSAAIPVLKMVVDTSVSMDPYYSEPRLNRQHECPGTVDVDITIETKDLQSACNHLGVLSTQSISYWTQQYPTLQPMIIYLKYTLHKKGLNGIYQCGLNTYCLVIMILAICQKEQLQEQSNISVALQKVLEFYGFRFDESTTCIDVRSLNNPFLPKPVSNPEDNNHHSKAELEIYDPLNNGKNMTKKCYNFTMIKQMFRDCHQTLFEGLSCK